ncbi:HTH-type transcriptional regulator VirS [Actinoplanes sp. NBRC 14428]|nr:HTH-type transcriptional regulator VirS [Actinoplanes sp. NBRC 14428]
MIAAVPFVRSAGLQRFRDTVVGLGGDPVHYAREAGLPVAALDTDDQLIPDAALAAALEIAAVDLRCPDLGLRVAAAQELSMLGPLAVAIRHAPSMRDALECTAEYMFVHFRGGRLSLIGDREGEPGMTGMPYAFGEGVRPLPQAIDMTMLFLHRSIAFLVGGEYGLRSVDLPHPAAAPAERYREAFGVRVHFDRPEAVLRLPVSLFDRPLNGADATLRNLALAFLSRQAPKPPSDAAARVYAVLARELGSGSAELADVARVLLVHPRTLQRELAGEGQSFARILDDLRRSRARILLTTTDMSLGQVSRALGFSGQAVLSRCAHRWWGMSPSALRRRAGSQEGAPRRTGVGEPQNLIERDRSLM